MKSKISILIIFITICLVLSYGYYKAHFVALNDINTIKKARPISLNVDLSYNHTIDIILTQKFNHFSQLDISLEFPDQECQNKLSDRIKESKDNAFDYVVKGLKGITTMPETNETYSYLWEHNLPEYRSDFLTSNSYMLTFISSIKPGIYPVKIKILSGATNLKNVKQKLVARYDLGGGLYPAKPGILCLLSTGFLIVAFLIFITICIMVIKKKKVY